MDDDLFGDALDMLSGAGLGWLLGGVCALAVALAVLLAVALAPFTSVLGGYFGGGPLPISCTPAVSVAATNATSVSSAYSLSNAAGVTGQTPTTAAEPPCPTGGARAAAIVAAARAMAAHLHGNPDVWYDAGFPGTALAYWAHTCPGCVEWADGNLQCVMFVLAAYGLAGLPPPAAGNAVAFWRLYAHRAGWVEIPAGAAAPGARGLPAPGDMMVWYSSLDPSVGHIAIVVQVAPPSGGNAGAVTFAEANGPGPLVTEPLLLDLSVQTWRHYVVLGYIRHP